MGLEKLFKVVAVHGEGDRDHVNSLQDHRNKEEVERLSRFGVQAPVHMVVPADEPPDVVIILRDEHHQFRMEWPVETWEEVEAWKKLAGYDTDKRHWKQGAVVKVKIGV